MVSNKNNINPKKAIIASSKYYLCIKFTEKWFQILLSNTNMTFTFYYTTKCYIHKSEFVQENMTHKQTSRLSDNQQEREIEREREPTE